MPLVPKEYARIKSSGTRKKSPSQRVTGVSSPTSPKVQPRPFSSPMLRALYLSKAALVVASHLSQVLDDLQPVFHLGCQRVVRELRERVGQHWERGLIWRVEVEVGVVRCALRYRHVVRPAGGARFRYDVVEIGVTGEGVVRISGEVVPEQ